MDILEALSKKSELTHLTNVGRRCVTPDYFLSIPDGLFKELISEILQATRYIPFDEFLETFLNAISKIQAPKFHLYFDITGKVGSEHWLTALAFPRIKDRIVSVITDHRVHDADPEYPVLLIDDCVYSGCNMCGKIDYLKGSEDYHYIVLTGYSTQSGQKGILRCNFGKSVTFITGGIIQEYSQFPGILSIIKKISIEKGIREDNVLYDTLGCESGCVSPVYFDWKVANEFGSIPGVYIHGVTDFGQVTQDKTVTVYTGSFPLPIQFAPDRKCIDFTADFLINKK